MEQVDDGKSKLTGSLLLGIGAVERNKEYSVGENLFNAGNSIDFGSILECVKAGKTGDTPITIPDNAKTGDVFSDGEVEWRLTKVYI